MDYSHPALADRLAADYVTGTLRGPARRRFETLLPAHAQLQEAVRAWQGRLMPMSVVLPPQAPSPRVWKRIQARLDGSANTKTAAATSWWSQLAFWRGLSALAGVAALAFAVLLANPGPLPAPVIVVLAATTPGAGGATPATFVASISADGRAVVTRPLTNVSVEANRVLELWAVPGQGAPRSLGLISASGASVVQKGKLLDGTSALAVSLEPTGGSPTGAPTGPVLYAGKLAY